MRPRGVLLRLSKPRLAIRLVPYRSKWGPVGPTKSDRFSTACELYPRSILHVVLKSRSRVEKSSLHYVLVLHTDTYIESE